MLAAILSSSLYASPYLGLKLGEGFNTGDYQVYRNGTSDTSPSGGGNYFLIGPVLGYDYLTQKNIDLAAEGFLSYSTQNNTIYKSEINYTAQSSAALKNNFLYGAAIHVGYKIQNVVPYISLGLSDGKFSLILKNNSNANYRGVPANSTVTTSSNILFFEPGAGVKFNFNAHVFGFMQYDYLDGSHITKTLPAQAGSWKHVTQVQEQDVQIGAAYLF